MNDKVVFYIVRHGQTDWNKEGRRQGHADITLNEQGISEAQALAQTLKHISFDLIYSSDLQRAYKTAALVINQDHLVVEKERALRECHYGRLEGKTTEELTLLSIEEKQEIESAESIQNRVFHFLNKVAQENTGQTILIVTHAGVMRNIIVKILNLDSLAKEIKLANCAVLKVKYNQTKWSIRQFPFDSNLFLNEIK